jgi:glutamate racemase
MRQAGIDTLILGCTHYPLITEALSDFFGPDVRIVDSAQAMVLALTRTFTEGSVPPNTSPATGEARYYVTDRYQRFQQLVQAFMGGEDLHVELVAAEDLSAALTQTGRSGTS